MYWPVAIIQNLKTGEVETSFTYEGYSKYDESVKWFEEIKKENRVIFGYIHDNDENIQYYETVFDNLSNKDNIDMKQNKYYAKAIIQDLGDDDIFRWISYDEYENLENAQNRIKAVENQFRTLFSYVETVNEKNEKTVAYYANHLDPFGNVNYWDNNIEKQKRNHTLWFLFLYYLNNFLYNKGELGC